MPVAKKDKFHTCGGPRRRPCLGQGRGRRILLAVIKSKVVPGGDLAKVMRACCMISNSTATSTAFFPPVDYIVGTKEG